MMLDRASLPVPIAEDPGGAALALTCQSCRNSPATRLVVAYLHVRRTPQVQRLCCAPCADFALRHAQTGDHLYLFRLVPEEARECRHCGGDLVRCDPPHDLPVCKGWKHAAWLSMGPVGPHYCEGRSVNPSGEPGEEDGGSE